MSTILRGYEKLNLYLLIILRSTQVRLQERELIEYELEFLPVVGLCLNLRLVDWFPDVVTSRQVGFLVHSVDQEEKNLSASNGIHGKFQYRLHNKLLIVLFLSLLLRTRDLNNCVFLRSADWSDKDLVLCSDHFMQREFKFTNEVMQFKLGYLVEVVDVVNLNLEDLFLFEFVRHIEVLDPLRVQIVHDDLSHSNLLPLTKATSSAFLLIEHGHAISARERVHVRQPLACE